MHLSTFELRRFYALLLTLFVAAGIATIQFAAAATQQLDDFAVPTGYALEIDTGGYVLPTAIAFVPTPGDAPNDPLYFVTQLRGEIKVVTNDRTVHVFAEVETRHPSRDDLRGEGQQGLAGICLDPEHGHVFVTFTYRDEGRVLRNRLMRFTTTPETFSLSPETTEDFSDIFADFQSSPAHQIGGCDVDGESVFVGIGDGGDVSAVGDLDMLLGKVVCLTVDGEPCPDNPFRTGEDGRDPRDYVWGYGFRNPFGVRLVNGEVFVAENGIDIDRFLVAERGHHHHWDGTDQGIATGAKIVFTPPPPAPVQLTYAPQEAAGLGDALSDQFLFAAYAGDKTGVIGFRYDFGSNKVVTSPRHVLEYRGEAPQHVLGVAVGHDGLYVVPGIPIANGESVVLRMYHDPANAHAVSIGDAAPDDLLAHHGCTSCHTVNGRGEGIAPSLDRFGLNWRLTERLNTEAYEQMVARVDELDEEPFVAFRDARREVLAAEGRDRTAVWLKHFLLEPRFDNPDAQMPNLGLSESEAAALRDELVGAPPPDEGPVARLLGGVQRNPRPIAFGFAAGVGTSAVLALLLLGIVYARRRQTGTR